MEIFAALRNAEDEPIDKSVGIKHFFCGPELTALNLDDGLTF
jgi:hypothetical protein